MKQNQNVYEEKPGSQKMTSTQMSGNKKKISISTRGYAKILEKQLDNGRADEKKARVDSYGAIADQKKRQRGSKGWPRH